MSRFSSVNAAIVESDEEEDDDVEEDEDESEYDEDDEEDDDEEDEDVDDEEEEEVSDGAGEPHPNGRDDVSDLDEDDVEDDKDDEDDDSAPEEKSDYDDEPATATESSKSKPPLLLSNGEIARAKSAFKHCSTLPEKDRINEEQFNLALSLLGYVESIETIRGLFLKEQAEYIEFDKFLDLLSELRRKKSKDDTFQQIEAHFNAIYDGTCPDGDQINELGEKYILANDLRNLLIKTGLQMSIEEASSLIRECHPVLYERAGNPVEVIYFEQYKTMLLDNSA